MGWTRRHSGVTTRYFSEGETAIQLGARAIRAALADASLQPEDLEALICVSGTMHQPIPCNAALTAAEFGSSFEGRMTFDVNSTCLGFLTGLEVVSALLAAGSFRRAVLVAADLASVGLDWTDRESCSILGDGAGAVIVEWPQEGSGDEPSVLGTAFGTWPEGAGLTEIQGGGSGQPAGRWEQSRPADYLFRMDGRRVFRMASDLLPGFVEAFLQRHGWTWDSFDLILPHQASPASLALLQRRLGIPADRLFVYAPDYGNLIAASLPVGLHLARSENRIQAGQRILLLGTSAGFSLGAAALQM